MTRWISPTTTHGTIEAMLTKASTSPQDQWLRDQIVRAAKQEKDQHNAV